MNKNYEETKKRVCHKFMTHPLFVEVELEGIEPSSIQGTNMLSTCLFRHRVSGVSKFRTTNCHLSL